MSNLEPTAGAEAPQPPEAQAQAAPATAPADELMAWRLHFDNVELRAKWDAKLPGVEPTDRDLSAFAVGTEVGFKQARDFERQDWSAAWHALKRAGVHPGRTYDRIEEVIDRLAAERDALKAAAQPAAPAPVVQPLSEEAMKWRKAVQEAYGWLWHTNNEPMAPVPMWSPEQAAYQARKCLRELLTTAERGEAINAIAAHMDKIAGITAAPTKE